MNNFKMIKQMKINLFKVEEIQIFNLKTQVKIITKFEKIISKIIITLVSKINI